MSILKNSFFLLITIAFFSCQNILESSRPNVILIMADDIGYECIGVNGSNSYITPVLDSLSNHGIRFTNAYSQPLCTPSRVKIMTGKPNYENYEYFGYLGSDRKTFGNLFKDNGYNTAVVGKWQLNGLSYKLKDHKKMSKPLDFGFDEYSLWQLSHPRDSNKERFANPKIEQNGKILETNISDYGPDIVSNYALDFIRRNRDNPFFLYYPMILVHDPFSPTPDSEIWKEESKRNINDTKYYSDMITYMDKIIGKIINELKENSILENTLLIFIGDNGTHPNIISINNGQEIKGAKGNTIKYGTNVPMFVNWDSQINKSFTSHSLIGFEDFYTTFEDILKVSKIKSSGISFLNLLNGKDFNERKVLNSYYDSRWGARVNKFRSVYSQTTEYKLYKNGKFFNIKEDPMEIAHIDILTTEQRQIKSMLKEELDKIPDLEENSKYIWENKRIKDYR